MPSSKGTTVAGDEKVIRIIRWTPPYKHDWIKSGRTWFASCGTPIPCEYTSESTYNKSDVIIINAFYLRYEQDMPRYRLPHQKWVFFHTEAPRLNRFRYLERYHTSFNVTMTYTSDADIVQPYGICLPNRATTKKDPGSITQHIRKIYGSLTDSAPWLSHEQKYTPQNQASGKNRLVAWMVSNCHSTSKRSDYVELLQRYIPIDVYGACGNLTCLRSNSKVCENLLNSYKFYLAFENSLCPEYITEKVWKRLKKGTVVPVVLGSAEYEKYLPKHSYINIKDFSSPAELANYLKLLDRNDTLYNEYFRWQKDYTCHFQVPRISIDCNICRHANEYINKIEMAPNIAKFWSFDKCIQPKEFYKGVAEVK